MAREDVRIYHSHKPFKTALTVIFVLILVLIVLAVAIFFGFRKYIVYTSEGVKLDVPWLREPEDEPTEYTTLAQTGDADTPVPVDAP